jgi:hypothetical protein
MQPETIEGEAVDVPEESVELVPVPVAATLFLTSDPRTFLVKASEAADALAEMIRKQNLAVRIRGHEHVRVEGWTALGSLLGVFPVLVWTHPVEDGWEARVEARTRAGETVGAAESMCTRQESKWAKADDYAIRSMAATRATSKALRQPLGFVMALAGFDPTPLEEMPVVDAESAKKTGSRVAPVGPAPEQWEQIRTLIRTLQEVEPDVDWKQRSGELAGQPARLLTKTGAAMLIERLQAELGALMPEDDETR